MLVYILSLFTFFYCLHPAQWCQLSDLAYFTNIPGFNFIMIQRQFNRYELITESYFRLKEILYDVIIFIFILCVNFSILVLLWKVVVSLDSCIVLLYSQMALRIVVSLFVSIYKRVCFTHNNICEAFPK